MEGVNEPTIKPEKGDQFWAGHEYVGKTQSSVNLSETASCVEDILQIKAEPEQIPDCIKEEMKDEVEVGFEEWKEVKTEEMDCFPGCMEGDLTDTSQVSLIHTGLPGVFQKVKVESQVGAEFTDLASEAVLNATEWKNVKHEEEWSQVRSSHKSSTGLKFGVFGKKFGCEREAVVRLTRLSLDTTDPVQGINSTRKTEPMQEETVVLEFMEKSFPHGPNIAEDPGSHRNSKGGCTELNESFSERNRFDELSAKTFDKSNLNECSPVNSKVTDNHCSYVANNPDDLNICNTHNKQREFECAQCSYKTYHRYSLTKHCLTHSSLKKFACDQCSYKTNYKFSFTQHCLNHSNIKKFACDQCSYKTSNKYLFKSHCAGHSGIKKFACDQCSYKTNYKFYFTRHCLNHSIKKLACDQCSYKTSNEYYFKRHCTDHNSMKKFACDQCSYRTNNKGHLARHCLNHSSIRKFACDQCSYRTNNKAHLVRHCLDHSSIRKFACDQCSYETNNKSHLTSHCLSHRKKFACDQCSYKTNDESLLKRHCTDHNSIKKFACDQCSYKTNKRGHLASHCLTHSSIKKFACDQCSYRTNNKGHLANHCLTHSSIKKLSCDQCSYKTNRKDNFTRHCRVHKNKEICNNII